MEELKEIKHEDLKKVTGGDAGEMPGPKGGW